MKPEIRAYHFRASIVFSLILAMFIVLVVLVPPMRQLWVLGVAGIGFVANAVILLIKTRQ